MNRGVIMKRRFLLLVIMAGMVLVSCETRYYSVMVRNNSSKAVTYIFNNVKDTLPPSGAREHQVEAYTQAPKELSVPGAMSVKMEYISKDDSYLFTDSTPLELKIINPTVYDVRVIEEGRYAGDNADHPYIECLKNTTTTGKIYTTKPVFKSMPKYEGLSDYSDVSVSFEWKINDEGDTITVTIK
jgi:hypothetical protein